MDAAGSVKVDYDVMTKRVVVTFSERRVIMPGTYRTIAEARSAAEERLIL